MRRTAALALLAGLLASAGAGIARAQTSTLERATDAVVAITAGAERIGTGVVVAPDRVLTVSHVVDAASGAPSFIIAADTMVAFEVVAIDRRRDLALLAADLPAGVPSIVWAEPGTLARGQDVIALGFPIGFTSVSLTKGVVSSPLQTFEGAEYIQTDAAINPGNSGGPLVDVDGRLVGINVAKIAQIDVDAVGFSIPAADASAFVSDAEPDLELAVGATPSTPVSPAGPAGETRGPSAPALALAIGLPALLVLALLVRTRRSAAVAAADAGNGSTAVAAGPGYPRAEFRVAGPGRDQQMDVRLPAVAGTAPNADLPLGSGAAYHVRFSASAGGVTALDLTDERGMYCADRCVTSALLTPGMSVRLGDTTITFVRGYEGAGARAVPDSGKGEQV